MKYLKLFILLLVVGIGLAACSKDGTHKVRFVVDGGASDIPILVTGAMTGNSYVSVKGHFENTVVTDAEMVTLQASCKDRANWITLEIYVNGKRKAHVYGPSWVTTPEIWLK